MKLFVGFMADTLSRDRNEPLLFTDTMKIWWACGRLLRPVRVPPSSVAALSNIVAGLNFASANR